MEFLKKSSNFNPFTFNRMILVWLGIGILGGTLASLYWILLEHVISIFTLLQGWLVIPGMALAGLLAGIAIKALGDPGEMSMIVDNIRFRNGKLNPKNNISMMISSLLCVGSGGSLGPEAPLVQITGSFSSLIGRFLRLSRSERRSITISGMAAGFTALFGAPIGGSLFAVEILHHKQVVEYKEALLPAFVSSCASYLVFATLLHIGVGPTWVFPRADLSLSDSLISLGLAPLGAMAGWIFIGLTYYFRDLWKSIGAPIYVQMACGGIILGLLAFYIPVTRYFGHQEINHLLNGEYSRMSLATIVVVKLIAISVTVTSGWRGGFIIPLLFVGTALGLLVHAVYPDISVSVACISCMASINACVTRTPLSTAILLSTMTGFGSLVPILCASFGGFFLAPRKAFIEAQR